MYVPCHCTCDIEKPIKYTGHHLNALPAVCFIIIIDKLIVFRNCESSMALRFPWLDTFILCIVRGNGHCDCWQKAIRRRFINEEIKCRFTKATSREWIFTVWWRDMRGRHDNRYASSVHSEIRPSVSLLMFTRPILPVHADFICLCHWSRYGVAIRLNNRRMYITICARWALRHASNEVIHHQFICSVRPLLASMVAAPPSLISPSWNGGSKLLCNTAALHFGVNAKRRENLRRLCPIYYRRKSLIPEAISAIICQYTRHNSWF